jgi:hypothetical protein
VTPQKRLALIIFACCAVGAAIPAAPTTPHPPSGKSAAATPP